MAMLICMFMCYVPHMHMRSMLTGRNVVTLQQRRPPDAIPAQLNVELAVGGLGRRRALDELS